jgi:acetoin utilization protein AcuB
MPRHPKRAIPREIRTRRPLHPGRERDELEALTWPESLRVADRMSRNPVTIRADALAQDAAETMRTRKIRHLPVVDHDGRLVGIVTDRDLRQILFDPRVRERAGELAETLRTLRVRDVMTWAVITVRPGVDLREAARLMHEQKIGALPVVEGGRVVGILTESDVLKAFREILDEGVLARPYRWALAPR